MKTHPVGAKLFYVNRQTDGQTYMMKLIVVFRNFANALDKIKIKMHSKNSGFVTGVGVVKSNWKNSNASHVVVPRETK
jgi:hypothetical protein